MCRKGDIGLVVGQISLWKDKSLGEGGSNIQCNEIK